MNIKVAAFTVSEKSINKYIRQRVKTKCIWQSQTKDQMMTPAQSFQPLTTYLESKHDI